MTCRCGHGRQWHRATANAIGKRRRAGDRRPAKAACQFWARQPLGEVRCKCRDWHPEQVPA